MTGQIGAVNLASRAHLLPCSDLSFAPDARDVGVPAGPRRDEGGLGEHQSTGHTGALSIVLDSKIGVLMLVVGAEAGERCESDPLLKLERTELEGLEELGGRHRRGIERMRGSNDRDGSESEPPVI